MTLRNANYQPLLSKLATPIDITWFMDSPDAGDPNCTCSLCDELINDHAIRLFDDRNREARFHLRCFEKLPFGAGDFD